MSLISKTLAYKCRFKRVLCQTLKTTREIFALKNIYQVSLMMQQKFQNASIKTIISQKVMNKELCESFFPQKKTFKPQTHEIHGETTHGSV